MTEKSTGRRDVGGTVDGTSRRQSASEVCTLVGHQPTKYTRDVESLW
jgi:hypothetical protein